MNTTRIHTKNAESAKKAHTCLVHKEQNCLGITILEHKNTNSRTLENNKSAAGEDNHGEVKKEYKPVESEIPKKISR